MKGWHLWMERKMHSVELWRVNGWQVREVGGDYLCYIFVGSPAAAEALAISTLLCG